MSDLTLMLIRLAFLAVLWLFVIMAVGVIRTDLFATPSKAASARPPAAAAKPRVPKPSRGGGRKEPRTLVVTKGSLAGTTLNLGAQPILIGRTPNATLVINDDYASGRHAEIRNEDGRWVVEDLGSTNGTYLGQQRLTRPMPVSIGQPIRIGKTVLELRK